MTNNKCQWIALVEIALVVLLVVSMFAKCSDCKHNNNSKYSIPNPNIKVFSRGFRVSIPNKAGIQLFAFHGKVNIPFIDEEPGTYSKDILHKENRRWIFEETETKLKAGDIIYYWLYVQKFNLGYKRHGQFTVRQIEPFESSHQASSVAAPSVDHDKNNWYFETPTSTQSFNRRPTSNHTDSTIDQYKQRTLSQDPDISSCCQLFLNESHKIALASEQVDQLVAENKILAELAKKDDYYAKTLRIFGKYPAEYYDTPKAFAQNLVFEKLQLPKIKVIEANKIPDNGVSFKVEKLEDKVQIILRAREKLYGSNYELSW